MSQMVMMVSALKQRVASTTGHVAVFEAMVPRLVHQDMVRDCMKVGCAPVDQIAGMAAASPDDTSRPAVTAEGSLRSSLISLVIERAIKENNPKTFDSGGIPRLDWLNTTLTFDISPKERTAHWQALQTARANGDAIAYHPDAKKVLDIIDAQGKSDLLLVASEMGVAEDEVKGFNTRDLRKHLLGKFSGLTSA